MIKVNINKNNNIIEEIKLNGHAMYDDYGKDIVCAGVSTLLNTTVNACLTFDKDSIYYEEGSTFILKNIKKDNITNKLLDNFYYILKEMESTYKDNIKIKED